MPEARPNSAAGSAQLLPPAKIRPPVLGDSSTIPQVATTIATAPLAADGRSYSVSVPLSASTTLVAALPFVKFDEPGAATSYSGRSGDVTVRVG